MESQARVGWHNIALKFLHQGIPKGPRLLCGRGSRALPSPSHGHGGLEENKATRAFPILEEGPNHGKPLGTLFFFPVFLTYFFVFYMQTTQKVFGPEEWVNDTQNEARVEANLYAEANQALGASE